MPRYIILRSYVRDRPSTPFPTLDHRCTFVTKMGYRCHLLCRLLYRRLVLCIKHTDQKLIKSLSPFLVIDQFVTIDSLILTGQTYIVTKEKRVQKFLFFSSVCR